MKNQWWLLDNRDEWQEIAMMPSTEIGNDEGMSKTITIAIFHIKENWGTEYLSKQVDQSHTIGKQQAWEMNSGSVAPESEFLKLS